MNFAQHWPELVIGVAALVAATAIIFAARAQAAYLSGPHPAKSGPQLPPTTPETSCQTKNNSPDTSATLSA